MDERVADLAQRALGECRISLMMAFRFLDRALWRMPLTPIEEPWLLATDGRVLRFNPVKAIGCYRESPERMARAYLHTLLHCILRHPFRTVRADPGTWSLACDICVEAIAVELCEERFALDGDEMISRLAGSLAKRGVPLTPAGIYRELLTLRRAPCDDALLMAIATNAANENGLFLARDSHRLWNLVKPAKPDEGDGGGQGGGDGTSSGDEDDNAGSASGSAGTDDPNSDNDQGAGADNRGGGDSDSDETDGEDPEADGEDSRKDDGQDTDGEGDPNAGEGDKPPTAEDDDDAATRDLRQRQIPDSPHSGEDEQSRNNQDGAQDGDAGQSASQIQARPGEGGEGGAPGDGEGGDEPEYKEGTVARSRHSVEDEDSEKEWEAIAKQLETELATLEKKRGEGAGRLTGNLSLANRSKVDYADFLRRFATRAEDMKLNDEEFDYLFYTYGLKRYGNMPLVEPLEYKEDHRAREFVIAIDTSGSCSEGLTRIFLTRTYEILSQAGRRGDRVNIHVVQCDAEVQRDTVITNADDLRGLERGFTVAGWGGTDFRPVFAYVDELLEQHAFEDLRGLVYFTDGFGVFPDRAPTYDVAFVFVEEEGRERRVPPWAMKVVMDEETIKEMSQFAI